MVLEKVLHMMKAGDIQTSGDHSRTPEALLTTSGLTSCSMNWWRAPGSWSKQHRRRSTSGGGCRASSIHRNCIYSEPEVLGGTLHVPLWELNWPSARSLLAANIFSDSWDRLPDTLGLFDAQNGLLFQPCAGMRHHVMATAAWDLKYHPRRRRRRPCALLETAIFLIRISRRAISKKKKSRRVCIFFYLRPYVDWRSHWFSILSTQPCCFLSLI